MKAWKHKINFRFYLFSIKNLELKITVINFVRNSVIYWHFLLYQIKTKVSILK